MTCEQNMSQATPGQPCQHCGHTSVVHPGIHNPALTRCVLCELREYLHNVTGPKPARDQVNGHP